MDQSYHRTRLYAMKRNSTIARKLRFPALRAPHWEWVSLQRDAIATFQLPSWTCCRSSCVASNKSSNWRFDVTSSLYSSTNRAVTDTFLKKPRPQRTSMSCTYLKSRSHFFPRKNFIHAWDQHLIICTSLLGQLHLAARPRWNEHDIKIVSEGQSNKPNVIVRSLLLVFQTKVSPLIVSSWDNLRRWSRNDIWQTSKMRPDLPFI